MQASLLIPVAVSQLEEKRTPYLACVGTGSPAIGPLSACLTGWAELAATITNRATTPAARLSSEDIFLFPLLRFSR